jgi:hypothetical protein
MRYNEDSLEKWNKSRIGMNEGNIDSMLSYNEEKQKTIDEIRLNADFKDNILQISSCVASGRKPRPSSYIWIVLNTNIGNLPITINGFDVVFAFKDEENTI